MLPLLLQFGQVFLDGTQTLLGQRLITGTKPDAPVERTAREYEWYDHNSLLGDEPNHQALAPEFMDRAVDLPARHEMEAALAATHGDSAPMPAPSRSGSEGTQTTGAA